MKFYKLKSLILNVLDILPQRLGYFLYHKIQERSFKNIDFNIKSNKDSYTTIKRILNKFNINIEGERILEIGSGWLPILPYILKTEENIEKIFTYDINRHYNQKNISKVNRFFKFKNISVLKNASQKNNLPNFINYIPNCDIINADLPTNIKLYYSRFVLEHVTPDDIEKMHLKLFNEMEDESYILHLISPSDHRAYSDSSISYYDFLKYSEKEWNKIQTKFDYHNRLRFPDYINIIKKTGFQIIHSEHDDVDKNSKKYKMFKDLNIHSDYRKYSEKDLLAGSINILLKK